MSEVTKPIALDESINTTENPSRNIADVLAEELAGIAGAITTAENVENILTDMATTKTAPTISGTAVFDTIDGNLVKALKVAITPSQDLHGYDNPWVGGAGKNKCKYDFATRTEWAEAGYASGANTHILDNIITKGSRYTLSGYIENGSTSWIRPRIFEYLNNSWEQIMPTTDVIIASGTNTDFSVTFDVPNDGATQYSLVMYKGDTREHANIYITHIQLELGSTATSWTPYSNICPISGHTQEVISVKDSTDTTQATYTTAFGQTVYGGTLDVLTGELTIDRGYIKKKWSEFADRGTLTNNERKDVALAESAVYPPTTSKPQISNLLPCIVQYNLDSPHFYCNNTTAIVYMPIGTDGNTEIEIIYELATPTTVQLTPQTVKALVGENHISASTGDVLECKYSMLINGDDLEMLLS